MIYLANCTFPFWYVVSGSADPAFFVLTELKVTRIWIGRHDITIEIRIRLYIASGSIVRRENASQNPLDSNSSLVSMLLLLADRFFACTAVAPQSFS